MHRFEHGFSKWQFDFKDFAILGIYMTHEGNIFKQGTVLFYEIIVQKHRQSSFFDKTVLGYGSTLQHFRKRMHFESW